MRVRIVVADQTEAHFYDAIGFGRALNAVGRLANPAGRQREQDLVSDRPGRVFERAADPHRRRGASARHASGPEHAARRQAVDRFARRIAAELERGWRADRFDAVVLVAGASLLGRLRAALPAHVRAKLAATVVKDIVHHPAEDVLAYLPRSVFTGPLPFTPAPRAAPRGLG
ncbi:MAG TPA: host attachment protein [Steroidobacteraceae bacterium]|nr:host attachment protein [Steroidobacteraceae bacterium]